MIPLSIPVIRGKEWEYIKECLDTGWVSSVGKFVELFEERICAFTGAKYAVACMNGTAALQVALRIAGVEAGDEVIVPTMTFIATANAARYLGAEPVFMDCDEYYNIDPRKVLRFLDEETDFADGVCRNRTSGRRIAAILPVHVFGSAVDFDQLLPACRERGIKVVEDAAESMGSRYCAGTQNGKHTGTIGDMGCYSFNGNKIITTGGGGMLVTDNGEYAEKARYLTTQAKDDPLRYVHHEVGYNYRMTNVQAAMGVAQLEMLEEYCAIKKRNYESYEAAVRDIPGLSVAGVPIYCRSNYWFYNLQIDKGVYGRDRDTLLADLSGGGIQTRPVWDLVHLQKPYKGFQSYEVDKAHELWEKTLSLPCSVDLTEEQVAEVVAALQAGGSTG